MKILFIVPDLYTNGGIQEFAKSIYTGLKDKFDLEILNWTYDLNIPSSIILRRLPPGIGAYVFSHFYANHFRRKYKTNDTHLLHFWNLEEAMPFLDKKYIVTCHGLELLNENIKGYKKLLFSKALSNAMLVIANSEYTKKILIKRFFINPKKIKIIPPPINFEKFSSVSKIKHEKFIIGTLSRFVKRKNVINVIKALNIVKLKYNIDFIYYLAGDGIERANIKKELMNSNFEWKYFGKISEEKKIKEFYPALDVFVMPPLELPSDVEGFGIVYLEANAYGIPVVASETGGITDAVKEGISGVFADPTNPLDIAAKIQKVLRNRNQYHDIAREWAKQFDIKNISMKFTDIYNQLEQHLEEREI